MIRWSKVIRPMQRRFRRKRARKILEHFPQINGSVVIDIGGSLTFWQTVEDILRPQRVLVYNIHEGRMTMGAEATDERVELHFYDGSRIPQDDNAAEVVICNSVIEHVPLGQRATLANEVRRVGKNYVAQTPARGFPLELHFGMPFLHWLPRPLGRQVVRVSPFAFLSVANAQKYFDETRLLSRKEFAGYFPSARIETERFLGMPKSMLAFG